MSIFCSFQGSTIKLYVFFEKPKQEKKSCFTIQVDETSPEEGGGAAQTSEVSKEQDEIIEVA